jgi:hypothetical protein
MIKTLLSATLAVALSAGIAAPVFADDHGWREREWHEHEWRDREWHDRDWRIHHPYYAAPPVVVGPPPQAVYAPPVIVAPPPVAPGINIVLPIRIH